MEQTRPQNSELKWRVEIFGWTLEKSISKKGEKTRERKHNAFRRTQRASGKAGKVMRERDWSERTCE